MPAVSSNLLMFEVDIVSLDSHRLMPQNSELVMEMHAIHLEVRQNSCFRPLANLELSSISLSSERLFSSVDISSSDSKKKSRDFHVRQIQIL